MNHFSEGELEYIDDVIASGLEVEWVDGFPLPKRVEHEHDFPPAELGQILCQRCGLVVTTKNIRDVFNPCVKS